MSLVKKVLIVLAIFGAAQAALSVGWIPQTKAPEKSGGAGPALSAGEAPKAEEPAGLKAIEWEKTFKSALARAKKEKKPVLVEFYVPWQQWCRVFEDKTLGDSKVAALARKFVCVRVNAEKSPDLVKKYQLKSYPTTVFLNPRGEVAHRIIGYIPARPFEREMKEIAAGREPEKELKKLEKSNPREFRPLVFLGVGYLKRQEWDKAIEAYERALKVGPGPESKEQQEVVYSLCQLYDFRGHPERAERLLRQLLRAESSDKIKIHDMLGHVYLSMKRPEEAIAQFKAERNLVKDEKQREFLDNLIGHIREAMEKKQPSGEGK